MKRSALLIVCAGMGFAGMPGLAAASLAQFEVFKSGRAIVFASYHKALRSYS